MERDRSLGGRTWREQGAGEVQVAMQQSATDPVTGAIDMDMIQTGVSASARIALQQIAQEVQTLLISEDPLSPSHYLSAINSPSPQSPCGFGKRTPRLM